MPKRDIYYIGVVGKALDVLDTFTKIAKPQLNLAEISSHLRLNRNAVFRILYTLGEHGYVIKENSKYRLGSKFFRLCDVRLRNTEVIAVASPYLNSLRDQLGETVNLGVLEDGKILYIDVRESPQKFRLTERVGARDYVHCTALGKAFLAFMPNDECRQLVRQHGLPRFTEYTITSLSALKAEMERIRACGYSVDREESLLGAYCVGTPILNSLGSPIAAISISGPITRFNEKHLPDGSKVLLEASAAIHSRIGSTGPRTATEPVPFSEKTKKAKPS